MRECDIEDLIDRYVTGQMTHAERCEFEALMGSDDELSKDVELTRLIVNSLKRRNSNEEKIAQWRKQRRSVACCASPARELEREKAKSKWKRKKKLIIFCIIIICIVSCGILIAL